MESNGAVLIGLSVFSIAMLWAIRIVYGPTRSEDIVRRGLTIGAFSLLVISIVGMMLVLMSAFVGVNILVTMLVVMVTAVVLATARHQYFEAERRSFVWTLAHAIQRELPLVDVATAFRGDRVFMSQCYRVTARLSEGSSLPEAMRAAAFPLNVDTYLAIHISRLTKQLGAALKSFTVENEEVDALMRVAFTRVCYFLALIVYWSLFTLFMMTKIIPIYERMFAEVELELPTISQMLINVSSDYSAIIILILFPLVLCSVIGLVMTLLKSLDLLGRDVPLLGRLDFGLDRARVLRALALSVRASKAIDTSLQFLGENYPKKFVASKLSNAASKAFSGQHWCESLQQVNLIGMSDVAVIKSAERAGNLAWALEEVANSHSRRFIYKIRWVQSVVYPAATLLFGAIAAFVVIALFAPLVAMISELSQ
ncbi:MAG: type II secretory pathway component PulF [Pirellulaceae bacterium]|jgi:type II secretory pathway component PulF